MDMTDDARRLEGGWSTLHGRAGTARQPASEPLIAVGARRAMQPLLATCLGGGAEVPPAAVFDYCTQLALFD